MFAIDFTDAISGDIFEWLHTSTGADWQLGAALFAFGVAGGLATVLVSLGGPLPAVGNRTAIVRLEAELAYNRRLLADVTEQRTAIAAQTPTQVERLAVLADLGATYERHIAELASQLARERRLLAAVGLPLYLVFAGLLAAAIAGSVLTAIAVGVGWTAVLEQIKDQRQEPERIEQRATLIGELTDERDARIAQLETELAEEREIRAALTDQLDPTDTTSNQ